MTSPVGSVRTVTGVCLYSVALARPDSATVLVAAVTLNRVGQESRGCVALARCMPDPIQLRVRTVAAVTTWWGSHGGVVFGAWNGVRCQCQFSFTLDQ